MPQSTFAVHYDYIRILVHSHTTIILVHHEYSLRILNVNLCTIQKPDIKLLWERLLFPESFDDINAESVKRWRKVTFKYGLIENME